MSNKHIHLYLYAFSYNNFMIHNLKIEDFSLVLSDTNALDNFHWRDFIDIEKYYFLLKENIGTSMDRSIGVC